MTTRKYFKPIINKTWYDIFDKIDKDIWEITEDEYNDLILKNKNIFPIYTKIFNFTNYLIPDEIKVCIIGQDCYHSVYQDPDTLIYYPQATGLSFSVPKKSKIPSSLKNIYANLLKFKNIIWEPKHGNLEYWAFQGVLLLNSSLTVLQSQPNSHKDTWFEFTNELLEVISKKYTGIIFVLWGKYAHLKKLNNVIKNQLEHKFIISSHPSGYSANVPYREFNSFMDTDHFGLINKYLIEQNKKIIDWQII